MSQDSRRAWVEVIARLGRETQLHIDERYRHFRITDAVTIGFSVLLAILALFNIYYIQVLYNDLQEIVVTMESMYDRLRGIDGDMAAIGQQMDSMDWRIGYMEPIAANMASIGTSMPKIRESMDAITVDMGGIGRDMAPLGHGMLVIDQRVHSMLGGVAAIRNSVRQFAGPMGAMNPFMP
jgi:hypothetical protein